MMCQAFWVNVNVFLIIDLDHICFSVMSLVSGRFVFYLLTLLGSIQTELNCVEHDSLVLEHMLFNRSIHTGRAAL